MSNEYSPGYPIDISPGPEGDSVKTAVEKHISEFKKMYADLTSLYNQVLLELQYADVDKVDGKHATGTAGNIALVNGLGKLDYDITGTADKAANIPTEDTGGNIWIDSIQYLL